MSRFIWIFIILSLMCLIIALQFTYIRQLSSRSNNIYTQNESSKTLINEYNQDIEEYGYENNKDTKWIFYTDDTFDIKFLYPENWVVSAGINGGEGENNWWEIYLNKDNTAQILINEKDNPKDLSPKEWFLLNKQSYSNFMQEIFTGRIENYPILILSQPDTCKTSAMMIALIQKPGKILTISYLNKSPGTKSPIFKKFLENIQIFGKPDKKITIPELIYPIPPKNIKC